MAIVLGNRIVNLPQENLAGIGTGLGQILQAIGTQRQETQDRRMLTDLSRTLQGDVLPADQAGPTRPGITEPRSRLNEILNIVPQLRRPGNQALAINLATVAGRAIPTGARQSFDTTITSRDSAGNITKQQKVKMTSDELNNIRLPEGTTIERGTPITQPGKGVDPASIREFETVTRIDPNLRKTPEYEKAFFDFKEKIKKATQGRKQLAGSTPEGQLVTFDNISGTFETTDLNSELLPKNKKLLSGEIASQLGTFDSIIGQIDDIRICRVSK
jgi:hypothetical protein